MPLEPHLNISLTTIFNRDQCDRIDSSNHQKLAFQDTNTLGTGQPIGPIISRRYNKNDTAVMKGPGFSTNRKVAIAREEPPLMPIDPSA